MITTEQSRRQRHPRPRRAGPVFAAAALFCLAGAAAAQAVAEAECTGPATETVVLRSVDGWRNLTTTAGTRLTPAGIADFSVLAGGAGTAAERREMSGRLSRAFAELTGKPVGIHRTTAKTDRHGRQPVILFSAESLVQADLVAAGLAVAFPAGADLPCADRLLAAERLARGRGNGYWAAPAGWIVPPDPQAFAGRMGRYTILEGRVVSVGTRKYTTYLNFGGRWTSDVTVEIPAARRDDFGGDAALESLAGMRIRVRGFPVEKSGPMLDVRQRWQIEPIR